MSFFVHLAALNESARAWEDTSDTVRGSRKSLADVDASLLGDRVSPYAQVFIDTWMTEIQRLETTAVDHGEALRDAATLYAQADSDVVERSRQLMVWDDR